MTTPDISRSPTLVAMSTWWVWWDTFLEEWFYTDIDPVQAPGLVRQLGLEGIRIRKVQAHSGVQAIEALSPGFRNLRPTTARPSPA